MARTGNSHLADSADREKVSCEFPEVEHLIPILSVDSSYDLGGLEDFDKRVRKLTGDKRVTYTVEPKLDGTGISPVYEGDRFVRGITRGDGRFGSRRPRPSGRKDSEYNLRGIPM